MITYIVKVRFLFLQLHEIYISVEVFNCCLGQILCVKFTVTLYYCKHSLDGNKCFINETHLMQSKFEWIVLQSKLF